MMAITRAKINMFSLSEGQNPLSSATTPKKLRPSILAASSYSSEQVTIELKDEPNCYTALDCVVGSISFGEDLELNDKISTIQLLGVSHVRTDQCGEGDIYARPCTIEWVFLRRTTELVIDRATKRAFFALEIPASLQPSQCPLQDSKHLGLPPSTGTFSRAEGINDMSATDTIGLISYQVRVEIRTKSTNALEGHSSRKITFVPGAHDTRPPSPTYSPAPLYNEYTQDVKSRLGKKFGEMILSVAQSTYILTTGTTDQVASPLRLRFNYMGPSPPTFTRATITLCAQSLPRTTHHHDDIPEDFTSSVERELHGIDLGERGVSKWSHSKTQLRSWKTDLCLPVTLCGSNSLVIIPSFDSCLLTRRYQIKINLSLTTPTSSFLGTSNIEYRFPVTLVAPPARSRSEIAQSFEVGKAFDDDMPTYPEVYASPAEIAPMEDAPHYMDAIPEIELVRRPGWQAKGDTVSLGPQIRPEG